MLTRRRFFGLLGAAMLVRPAERPLQRHAIPISIALGNTRLEAIRVQGIRVQGYANGGVLPEPTLLIGTTRGPYAMAGERGVPEWVTPMPMTPIRDVVERFARLAERIRAGRTSG